MDKGLAGALIVAATISGCSGLSREARERNPAPCPNIVVLADAARALEFNGDETIENLAYSAEIENAELSCRYFGEEPIKAEVEIDLAFGRGPAAVEDEKIFKYFVAVVRRDLEVIAKQEFAVPVKFDGDIVRVSEDVDRIMIPRASEETSGVNFEVVVGFSLEAEQALYNRSGKSLKFPELK